MSNQQKQQPATAADGITPRAADYGQWYLDIVKRADLADHSSVRGCMVIKPHGYAIWEKLQRELDDRFKATGHVNAYFPLFIPLSLLAKEEAHAAGFAKECAVVTHYRLKSIDGKVTVDPESKLEEPLVVRPTSETIIWEQYTQLDPELSRPAAADQPVGERGALGDAHAPVPAHDGIPLAGRPHGPRHGGGSPRRSVRACWTSMPMSRRT